MGIVAILNIMRIYQRKALLCGVLALLFFAIGIPKTKADKTIYATIGEPFTFSPWSDVDKPDWDRLVCLSTGYTVYSADQSEAPFAFSINTKSTTTTTYYELGTKHGFYSVYEAIPLMEGNYIIAGQASMRGYPKDGAPIVQLATFYVTYHIIVTAPKEVKSITIPSSLTLNIGETYTYTPIIYEDGAKTTLTWHSSNTSVATIDSDGNLQAINWGNTTITCAAANGVTATCNVTVNPNLVSGITLNYSEYNIEANDKFTLKASVSPTDASNKEVEWSSSNTGIAHITSKGVVTGVSEGSCEITAVAKDGSGVTATCVVTVYKSTSAFNFTLNTSTKEATLISGAEQYSGNIEVPSQVVRSNVIYTVTAIGDNCFSGCTGLTKTTIPNTVKSIGQKAFADCSALANINIPNKVTTIGNRAFENCNALKSIVIPNNNCSIGERAFYGCSGLTTFTLPSGLTTIPNRCFQGCTNLKSVVLGNNVSTIEYRAFQGCSSLSSINLPTSLSLVGYRSFQDCTSLRSVSLPGVTRLCDAAYDNDSYAFAGCTSLERISIPNVEFVGTAAFMGCKALNIIEMKTAIPPTVKNPFPDIWHSQTTSNGTGINADACKLHIPMRSIREYRNAEGWKEFATMLMVGSRLKPIKKKNRYDFTPASAALAAGDDGVVSYRNRVVRNVLYTIRGNAYNAAEQCLSIGRVMTADSVAILNSFIIPEMSGYQQRFNGVTMRLAAGNGSISIESESAGSHALAVKIGDNEQQMFTLGSRKTTSIPYNLANDEYAYIYAVSAGSASSPSPIRATAANDSLKIYSITIAPDNVISTGTAPQSAVVETGTDIAETSFVANWSGADDADSFDLYLFQNGKPTREAFDGNNITAESLAAKGWQLTKGFVEDGGLRLGTSSAAGEVITPALGITGGAVLSLDIKAYANNKDVGKLLDVSVVGNGSVDMTTLTTTADYSNYTLLLSGLNAESRVKIAAHEAANNRFCIDNVAYSASSLGSMGIANAYSENFNNTSVGNLETAGWQLTKGFAEDSALRLGTSSAGGEAVTPALGIKGDATLTFATKAYANSKDIGKMLDISVVGDGDIDGNIITTTADYVTYTFNLTGLNTASRVKIASHEDANNRFYIDNVKVAYENMGGTPLAVYPLSSDNYSFNVTGLAEASSYSYYVVAKNVIGEAAPRSGVATVVTLGSPTARGDINGDQSIDGADVSALLEMVLAGGLTDDQEAVADLTGDGSIDGSDVSALLEIVLSGE